MESIKGRESEIRVKELQEKLMRRDIECDQIAGSLRLQDDDNHLLRNKYEELLLEREAL